eukprot:435761_1
MATFHRASHQSEPEYPIKPPLNAESDTGSTTSKHNVDSCQSLDHPPQFSNVTYAKPHSFIPKPQITYVRQSQLESLIIEAYEAAVSRFGEHQLHSIKRFVLDDVGPYLLDVDIAEKRIDQVFALLSNQTGPNKKYFFEIINLFRNTKSAQDMQTKSKRITNEIFADLKSIPADIESLYKGKEIDLQTGYPILSWFLDMYSRDRIANALNINASFTRRYDITRWFNDNLFARYVLHTHPEIAQKLKQAMVTLCKYVLPSIELHSIQYNIEDKINGVARYVIASHHFIQSVIYDQSIDEQWQPIFPIQIDVKIIPRQVKNSRPCSYENN